MNNVFTFADVQQAKQIGFDSGKREGIKFVFQVVGVVVAIAIVGGLFFFSLFI